MLFIHASYVKIQNVSGLKIYIWKPSWSITIIVDITCKYEALVTEMDFINTKIALLTLNFIQNCCRKVNCNMKHIGIHIQKPIKLKKVFF